MRIERRRFMQLGAMAALMDAAGCCHTSAKILPKIPDPPAPPLPVVPSDTLWVGISGLYLLEDLDASMMIHLVDAGAIGMSPHRAMLTARKSILEDSQMTKPDPNHVQNDKTPNELWMWDLKGRWVTMPMSDSGYDLAPIGTSAEDGAEIPSDAGWNSKARIADLQTCCGATRITKEGAVASTLALTHGQVDVLKPDGVGSRAVWQFTGPNNQVLMTRALSNKVRYSCPTGGQKLTIWVDDVPIVFKSGGGFAEVSNMPQHNDECRQCKPTMKHFSAFYKMVDKKTTPKVCLFRFTPLEHGDAGTDYCPGGRI